MEKQFRIASVIFLWLLHISAIIGIKMGYDNFFLPLTAYNLTFIAFILICLYPINTKKYIIIFSSIAVLGYIFEVLGVATGKIFGEYSYGNNLGPKMLEVPPIIGINWAVLCFVCSGLIYRLKLKSYFINAGLASFLMIFLDFFIEHSAPKFDFWAFTGPFVPIQNYISWFILAFIFNLGIFRFTTQKDFEISLHIFLVQFLFFFSFYVS